MIDMIIVGATIAGLAFAQNSAFSMVSRARNRDNDAYHMFASMLSNSLWFFTMQHLVAEDMTTWVLAPYLAGTVLGSLFGAKVSIKIEKLIGAET